VFDCSAIAPLRSGGSSDEIRLENYVSLVLIDLLSGINFFDLWI
jgi:hypothetical protein